MIPDRLKANLSKGRDAKPWVYGSFKRKRAMIARLPKQVSEERPVFSKGERWAFLKSSNKKRQGYPGSPSS
jgi:hypothetical protein